MAGIGNEILTGFVLPGQFRNPVQVWVPALDGVFGLGDFKNIGANMLSSIGTMELEMMRSKCSYYYLTQELNAGNYRFNEALGAGTTEQLLPESKFDINMPDLRTDGSYTYTNNGAAQGQQLTMAQSRPCDNMTLGFSFDREQGTVVNTHPNVQRGTFVMMSRWQKVLVAKIDGGATGVVLCTFPWAEDYNNVLKAVDKCETGSVKVDNAKTTINDGNTSETDSAHTGATVSTPGQETKATKGKQAESNQGGIDSSVEGERSEYTSGNTSQTAGSSVRVVGSKNMFTNGKTAAANKAAEAPLALQS